MKVNESFEYQGKGQNFTRDNFATLAEMKAVKAKTFPDIFTATCSETGKFYIYNKDNEVDEVLGKWREVSGGSSASGSSDYLRIEDDSSAVYLISSNNKSEVSPDDIFDYTDLPFYILKDGFDSDIELKYVGDVRSDGHSGVVFASEPFLEDDSSKSASLRKLLMYTAELVTYRHAWYMINPEVKEIGSSSCECEEETDTIDFSTWPEFTAPEANGIVLDGQGGANVDGSNVSVDPDDIEDDD